MKMFLKVSIKAPNKKENVLYLVPDVVSSGVETDEGYIISASCRKDEYGFSILRNRKYVGDFSNKIAPKQVITIEDDGNVLTFSLISNKNVVLRYLKSKPTTTYREMEEFYDYIGKYDKLKKRRSTGPLYPNSGMDPDLKDEYARKGK